MVKFKGTNFVIVKAYTPVNGTHVYIAQKQDTTILFRSSTFYYEGETVLIPHYSLDELETRDETDKIATINKG